MDTVFLTSESISVDDYVGLVGNGSVQTDLQSVCSEYMHLRCTEISGLKILILTASGLQIRSNEFASVLSDLPLDFWSLATEGTQESDSSEYKDFQSVNGNSLPPKLQFYSLNRVSNI